MSDLTHADIERAAKIESLRKENARFRERLDEQEKKIASFSDDLKVFFEDTIARNVQTWSQSIQNNNRLIAQLQNASSKSEELVTIPKSDFDKLFNYYKNNKICKTCEKPYRNHQHNRFCNADNHNEYFYY
jgi:hypothetical protein